VDGDRPAATIASALDADQLIILSNVPGLLRDFPDESTLIDHIDATRAEASMEHAEGRMKMKVLGAVEAIEAGVGRIFFGDARIEAPVRAALSGKGTVIE
jgi:acetylglutamate/LysW-gamma-L-alpha-aminoadipate kinase